MQGVRKSESEVHTLVIAQSMCGPTVAQVAPFGEVAALSELSAVTSEMIALYDGALSVLGRLNQASLIRLKMRVRLALYRMPRILRP